MFKANELSTKNHVLYVSVKRTCYVVGIVRIVKCACDDSEVTAAFLMQCLEILGILGENSIAMLACE
ncbi:MAG: hypothetical protein CMJ50_03085 [Planctomycetaceae bacterium]|nr:hypothetical protein [Planctomycetaceae bacterium]